MSERLVPEQVARKEFSLAFRGFDQHEVRAFLGSVASDLARWIERVEELEARVATLESTPVAEPDEAMIEAALGRAATRVLHVAREAAGEIRANAAAEVDAARAAATDELAALRAATEAELETMREEAVRWQTSVLEGARREADGILADATAARDRMATEVARLRAARDRLAAAFDDVRRALDLPAADEPAAVDEPAPVDDTQPAVEPEPEPEPEPEADPDPVEVAVVDAPEPEPQPAVPDPPAEERRSSSLRLVRPTEGTPVAPPAEDESEGVRIIRPEPEPEPEPEVVAVVEPAPEPAVEDLFARLRAERAEKVARAETVLADGADLEPEPEPEAPAAATVEADDLEPDLAVLAARDEVVSDAERRLVKSLKRALADEQNEVLDALRRLKGRPALDALLPDQAVHDARYEAVLGDAAADAAAAGGDRSGGAEVARSFGRTIVVELRAKLDRAIDDAGGDVETLAEAISATYREWKTARAEPLARDVITAGYAAGAYGAAEGALRWVVDPAEGGCPDCDDNVLAGATQKGTAFPTGQLHPPAHAGCRCLAVPAS